MKQIKVETNKRREKIAEVISESSSETSLILFWYIQWFTYYLKIDI